MYLPFSFKNFICVELEEFTELFKSSEQQRQYYSSQSCSTWSAKVLMWRMQNKSEIFTKQKSDAPKYIAYQSQAQKTLYSCKVQADTWQLSPASLCGVLTGNFCCLPWFPSWKRDTLECQFSQVISPRNFLQWCIPFDVIFKIPVFNCVCQTFTSFLSLFIITPPTTWVLHRPTELSCLFKDNLCYDFVLSKQIIKAFSQKPGMWTKGRWQTCWMKLT